MRLNLTISASSLALNIESGLQGTEVVSVRSVNLLEFQC
jgi:hypothetical protein